MNDQYGGLGNAQDLCRPGVAVFYSDREKIMAKIMNLGSKTIIIGFLLVFLAFTGCKGSDTREEVDNTVEELAGKKKVDQMKTMERNIEEIQNQQSDRSKQLDAIDE
jgi:hypothetical protein